MKVFRFLPLPLILSTIGCISYLDDNCSFKKRENVTVYFTLKDKANNEIFADVVSYVELFVYDNNGLMVSRTAINGKELSVFAGKRLWLEPGTYTFIAGANMNSHSVLITDEKRPYFDIEHNYLISGVVVNGVVENSDPLYYAPKGRKTPLMVTVPENGSTEITAEFRHAHVKLDVTVQGYNHVTRAAVDPLRIELTDITSRYCFNMGVHGEKVNYVQYAPNIDPIEKVFTTSFNVPVFDRETTTQIRIFNNAGQLIVSPISLVELLDDRIDIEELTHLPIRIVFKEENGVFKTIIMVDLPEWGEDEVKPNI